MAWLRRGEGMVAWGVAARCRTAGPRPVRRRRRLVAQVSAAAVVRDEVQVPGTGLISFGSFGFADDPGDSVLIVPRVVVGTRARPLLGDRHRRGRAGAVPDLSRQASPPAPRNVTFADGAMSGAAWESVVADAVSRGSAPASWRRSCSPATWSPPPTPTSTCAGRCAGWPSDYEMCWTFHVDGLFGATPELLVRRERGLVTSRVLAGTIRRTGDDERDAAWPASWPGRRRTSRSTSTPSARSPTSLAPYCSSTNVPEVPFVLHLPNVMHLATDVTGVVHDSDGASVLDLAAALHPSAAVGGTPTKVAVELIAEIEGMDRGRYAGPVGWMDADGDGEFGIALRSARDRRQPGPPVRRLRHRRRLRPRGRARRGSGEVPPGAGRADGLAPYAEPLARKGRLRGAADSSASAVRRRVRPARPSLRRAPAPPP